jgi:Fe-S oxidoreductase
MGYTETYQLKDECLACAECSEQCHETVDRKEKT